jgi:hypothetical protein
MNIYRQFTIALGVVTLLLVSSSAARAQVCGAWSTPLLAGQTIPAGTVTVYNDASKIYVHYSATAPWLLGEVHVAVADSLAAIPQTKRGNPIPGRFAYSASFAAGITEYMVAIPRVGALAAAPQIVVAAHAVVHAPENEGGTQTGWGFGFGFPGSNWATYLAYSVNNCNQFPE